MRFISIVDPEEPAASLPTPTPSSPAPPPHADLFHHLHRSYGWTRADIVAETRRWVLGALLMIFFSLLAPIIESLCGESRCLALGAPLAQWVRLCGFAALLSPPTTLADRLAFHALRRAAEAATRVLSSSDLLPTLFFYLTALEGSLGRLLWLAALTGFNELMERLNRRSDSVDAQPLDRMLAALVAYQLLCVLRNFAVRWYTRSFLLNSFRTKIDRVLGSLLLCLGLSLVPPPPPLGASPLTAAAVRAGGSPTCPGSAAFRGLQELRKEGSVEHWVDFINRYRMRVMGSEGVLEEVVDEKHLARAAGRAFSSLIAVPPEVLPKVKKSRAWKDCSMVFCTRKTARRLFIYDHSHKITLC